MASENQTDIIKRYYATDENLRIRQHTYDHYTVPNRSFPEWALERVNWLGGDRVLDVGCGPGVYYEKLLGLQADIDYVGIDFLSSMMTNHAGREEGEKLAQADVMQLPFPNNYFDMVMTNHMMHHVLDIEGGIKEVRRVLKPGGVFLVATNSVQTMPELQVLMRRAIVLLTRSGAAQVRAPSLPSDRFALENGTRLLSQQFFAVVRHDLPSALVFPDVEPAMAYLESTRELREHALPDDVVWDDVMMIMRQQINQLIKHLGELVINRLSGVIVATDGGGFISEFVSRRNEVEISD